MPHCWPCLAQVAGPGRHRKRLALMALLGDNAENRPAQGQATPRLLSLSCVRGHVANAVPDLLRAAGEGAGREGCPGRPHPEAGAAAGCTAWDWPAAGGLAQVPAAPAPALPQGPHAILSQVRCRGARGMQGNLGRRHEGTHTYLGLLSL